MTITNGDTTTEYGTTPGGQLFERRISGNIIIQRATNNPERFLNWIVESEEKEYIENKRREQLAKLLSVWWYLSDDISFRGTFNKELYLKVVAAKKANGTL